MSKPLLFAMPGNEELVQSLAKALNCETGMLATHSFPDGETYLRYETDPRGRQIAIACTLDRPDAKILPLLFAAGAARGQGAAKIGLVAPYLAYMRQDRSFHPGEAVTSRTMARLVSEFFDWLVTVDPHLHRYKSLSEIYTIPSCVIHAAPYLSGWIRANIEKPFLVGPDRESEQWVGAVARDAGAPYATLNKIRRADRDVEIHADDLDRIGGRTPVFVDDIISSGRTMLEALRLIRGKSRAQPVCIAVHGLFADRSDVLLAQAGARVVTSNTVPHPTNAIDLTDAIAQGIAESCAS